MSAITDHLRAGFTGLSRHEVLQLPVGSLLGVESNAAQALARVGVESIYDLGTSWLFANAAAAIREEAALAGAVSPNLVVAAPVDDPAGVGGLPLQRLRGLSAEDAVALQEALALETLREFALWPPRRVAQALVSEASGGDADAEEFHAEALRPKLGEYPTERVYYNTLVMLGLSAGGQSQPLTGTLSLKPAVDEPAGFGQPAVGALVTLSQSWYAKGITLGQMLHSLALAPGEATRVAVIDWSRRTRATTSESIAESEQLDSASEHSRSISEVQNAVAREMQSGGSFSSGWSKSTSSGDAGGFSIGGGIAGALGKAAGVLGFGFGSASSSQVAETESEAESTSWSVGRRSVMAEMAQRVNDRTEQHSTSVRNRRASAVREVSQSEHEQVSTRVVANYNHMHALTVQYYEVVQVYRVLVQVHSVQRVLFLPFELLDFSGPSAADVVARFRPQLLGAALNPRIAALLLDERGEVEVRPAMRAQLPSLFSEVSAAPALAASARMALADGAATPAAPSGPAASPATTAATRALVRWVTSPGPVADVVPGDVELVGVSFDGVRVDRVRMDQVDVSAERSTYAVPASTARIDFPVPLPLRSVTAIHLAKVDEPADSGTMTLHYRSGGRQVDLPVPLELVAGTSMQKVAYLASDPSNRAEELKAHLQANRAYYSQAVVRRLDSATLAMLLSRFTWQGKPLADQVEPNVLAVAGNYLVLRAPVDEDEPAGLDDGQATWGQLLESRELTLAQRDERLVPIPTGGVFAEAVLGRSNSAEKLDITRFWNWQDSPIPLQPPEIAPVATGSRATAEDLRPGQLGAPVLNILNPTQLPDPAGLGVAMNALASASMFRDMSGLAGTQALAQAASTGTLDAATEAGRLASTNLKTVTDQAVQMGKTAADIWKTLQAGKTGSGNGTGSSVSADGARINHGRDMDQRGVKGGGAGAGEAQTDAGADAGAQDSGDPGPMRELAYADTAATGVSPDMFGQLAERLGVDVEPANHVPPVSQSKMSPPPSVMKAGARRKQVADFFTSLQQEATSFGLSLAGVNLRELKDKGALQMFHAWTQSGSEVYVNFGKYQEMIKELKELQQEDPSMGITDAARVARLAYVIVLRHELHHVQQFRGNNGAHPTRYKEMCQFEAQAYAQDATWLQQQRGALEAKGMPGALLDIFIDEQTHTAEWMTRFAALPTEAQIKEALVRQPTTAERETGHNGPFLPQHAGNSPAVLYQFQ